MSIKIKIANVVIALSKFALGVELILALLAIIKNYYFTNEVYLSKFLGLSLFASLITFIIGVYAHEVKMEDKFKKK